MAGKSTEIAKKVSNRGCVLRVVCDIIAQIYVHLTYLLGVGGGSAPKIVRKVLKWKITQSIG